MELEKIDRLLNGIIKGGVFCLIIFAPLIIEGSFYSYKMLFVQLMVSLLIFCFGLKILLGRVKIFYSHLLIPVFLYTLVNFYSYFNSSYPQLSEFSLLKNLTYICFLFIFIYSIYSFKILDRLIRVWVITASLVALYGILQFLGLDFFNIHYPDLRIFSTMGNPNFLAGYLVITLPLCFSQIILSNSKHFKILFAACSILMLTTLILTFSRGGYLAFLFSSFIYIFLLTKKKKKTIFKIKKYKLSIITGILLIVLIIASLLFYIPQLRTKIYSVITRPTARFYIWEGCIKMILSKPLFGYGIGTFPLYFPNYRPVEVFKYHPAAVQYVKHAHNMLLETWAETGIIGLLIYIIFLSSVLIMSLRVLFKSGKEYNLVNLILTGLISSFCGMMVMNLVNVPIYYAVGGLFFWVITGMLVVLSIKEGEGMKICEFKKTRIQKFIKLAFSFIIILFSFVLFGCSTHTFSTRIKAEKQKQKQLFFYINDKVNKDFVELVKKVESNKTTAEDYYALGTIFAKRRNWDNALFHLNKAIDMDSKYAKAYNNLGNIYFHKNHFNKAIKNYEKAIRYNPKFVNARYNLGIMYFKKGQINKAVKQMQKILNIEPNYYEARAVIDTIGE